MGYRMFNRLHCVAFYIKIALSYAEHWNSFPLSSIRCRSWCIFILLCLQNFKLRCHILLGHSRLAGIRKQCFLWYDLSDHAVWCLLCRCSAMTQLQKTVSAFWIFCAIRSLISITRSRRYIYIQHKCMAKLNQGWVKFRIYEWAHFQFMSWNVNWIGHTPPDAKLAFESGTSGRRMYGTAVYIRGISLL